MARWCFCAHGNEPSGSVKYGELSRSTKWYQFLKKDSAPQYPFSLPGVDVRFPGSGVHS
jgi:hypothetical protein